MPKRKFNYVHLYNGKEVSKAEFIRKLSMLCTEVVGNSDNPLLNVEFVNEKKVIRTYNRMKRNGVCYIFWSESAPSETFQIKKERI